jgi:O-antigen/teichoic acid export membrane protein
MLAVTSVRTVISDGRSGPQKGLLPRDVLKRRVASSVFFVGSWGVVNLIVGFLGSIALARMLQPRDFGIIAIGATLTMFATALSDGGIGSGLIRREEAPTRAELRTSLGLQLSITGILAGAVAVVAPAFGPNGLVVAFMMLGLPIAAFQMPARVVLSREIRMREIASVEGFATVAYYLWAVAGVLAGLGVWALATGVVLKAFASTLGLIVISGVGAIRPSLKGARELRPVIAFGVRFQGVSLAGILREQVLNAGVAIIGGVATLGLFSLARRLLELPVLVFEPLHRVSFPFMTHVLAAREDPARLIERGIAISAGAAGLVLSVTAAAAPELVPGLFGEQWRDGGVIIPWICAALLVAGPLSVAAVGYLYARGEPSVVLRAIVLHSVALLAVAFSLLPIVGPAAIGMGSLAGAIVDGTIMARALSSRTTARPLRPLIPVLVIAVASGLVGIALSSATGTGLAAAAVGAAAAGCIYVAALAIFRMETIREIARLLRQAVSSSLARERPLPAGTTG